MTRPGSVPTRSEPNGRSAGTPSPELGLVRRLVAAAGRSADEDDALEATLQALCDEAGWTVGQAWVAGGGHGLRLAPVWCATEKGFERFRRASERASARGDELVERARSSGRPQWVEDLRLDPGFSRARAARTAGLVSALFLPVTAGEQVVAVIELLSDRTRPDDPPGSDLLVGLLGRLGSLLRARSAERRLRDRERELAEAYRLAQLGTWSFDLETGEAHWSEELGHLFGLQPSRDPPSPDILMRRIREPDRAGVQRAMRSALRAGGPFWISFRVVREDGALRTMHARGNVVPDADGRPRRIFGTCQDVTERQRSEQELRRSVSLLRATLESTADGILVVDLDGRPVSYNRQFTEMWGLPAEVVAHEGRDAMLEIAREQVNDPDEFARRIAELQANPDEEGYDILELRDGRVIERYTKPHRLGGQTVGVVISFRDVSERLRAQTEKLELERRLQQAERLDSMGRLAGGIAHDFNNLLAVILNFSALVSDAVDDPEVREDVAEIRRAAEAAAELTRQLLIFGRRDAPRSEVVELGTVVAELEHLLERTLGEDIELVTRLDPAPPVAGDRAQLEQVLLNLVVNARDAMPEGGRLEISVGGVELREPDVAAAAEATPGPHVRLAVSDTGVGMPDEIAQRAFEPFFSTKPRGEGTGLGLATVYGVVTGLGGHVELGTSPEGTTVEAYLPAADGGETASG